MSLESVLVEEAKKDGVALVKAVVAAFVEVFGSDGEARVRAILDAEYEATDVSIDILEAQKVAKESAP